MVGSPQTTEHLELGCSGNSAKVKGHTGIVVFFFFFLVVTLGGKGSVENCLRT